MQRENAEKLGIHRVSLARVEAAAKVDKFRPMTFEKVFEDIERMRCIQEALGWKEGAK